MTAPSASGEILWRPSPSAADRTTIARFAAHVEQRHRVQLPEYGALHRWSVEHLDDFWGALAEFFAVRFETPPSAVLGERAMPGAEWFPGATLSYVEQVFRDRPADELAIVSATESGDDVRLSWGELLNATARAARGLRELGIRPGDRVAGYLPNTAETVVAFLATASVGAVWSCCSPDFGADAVVDRLAQIEPRVLFAGDGYVYGGKPFDRRAVIERLRSELPTVESTVVVPVLSGTDPIPGTTSWSTFLGAHEAPPLSPVAVPFDHPLWILYSSGTTGLPKGIVHSHGGIVLEHLKWLGLQVDARPGDRVFWLTTTGWTMWNFVVGSLLVGAVPILYEGNPTHPGPERLWVIADECEATHFGAGASFFHACLKADLTPRDHAELASLRAIGSTGSPLLPEAYDWIYDRLGGDTWLFSTSGGTDVCTAFVGGAPTLPVRRGELQAPALGVDLQSWDADGQPLIGEVGELVVTQPMPSMPIKLWNDDGSRLRASYFEHYPGVWRHGDWIELRESGGAIIHGRSDSTINRHGVRIGTAEIYRAALRLPEVQDAVVLDLPEDDGGSWMPLFVVLSDGAELDDALRRRITTGIREACSPRHVPNEIVAVPAIPRTLSGKILEVPLKRLFLGVPASEVASRDALANPEALDWFARLADERRARSEQETPA